MMRAIHKLLPITAAMLLLSGCSWEPLPPPEPVPAKRVFLMYDNIGSWFNDDVVEAGLAVAAGALDPDERVVVFHRNYMSTQQPQARSVIYELVKDASQTRGFRREMLKVYASGENASLSTEVIADVVGDVRTLFHEATGWGLAFGSHGKGWIPKSNTTTIARMGASSGATSERPFAELWAERENPLTRYFSGYNQNLDVSEFMDGLDEWAWDFILLDDCFMASAEALYEMRYLASYIIASPTEIIYTGFPYDRVVKTIFTDWSETGFKEVGREFVDYYRSQTGDLASATIAVVKTSELDALAETIRKLNLNLNELDSVDGVQYYEGFSRPGHLFFDLDDYLIHIRKDRMPVEYNAFKSQIEQTVVFKDYTEHFYSDFPRTIGTVVPVAYYSGINVFIPWSQTAPLISDYRQTEWYKYVYGE